MSNAVVILMLTIIDGRTHDLSARQQRMTQAECSLQMDAARFEASVRGDTVFGGCVPVPTKASKGQK